MPTLGIRVRGTDDPEIDLRRRPSRPPSRSRRRTGGAAGAVLLIVVATGTLGAFPAVQVRGHVVEPTADSAALPAYAPDGASFLGGGGLPPATAAFTDPGLQTLGVPSTGVPGAVEQREARFTSAAPDQRAQVAVNTAMAQIGLPYVWGGDGPTNGDAGFDCSGLTTFAYAAAGVNLPRTAHTQYYAGPHVASGAPLQAGDLVFYGTPAKVHHVGMYIGDGKMVNAPTFGKPVQVAFYRWNGDDYLGATRPAATGETTSGLLPYAPAAPSTGTEETFTAPVAPAPTTTPTVTTAPATTAVTTTVAPTSTVPTTTVPATVPTTTVTSTRTATTSKTSTSATTSSTTPPPVTVTTTTTLTAPASGTAIEETSTTPTDEEPPPADPEG